VATGEVALPHQLRTLLAADGAGSTCPKAGALLPYSITSSARASNADGTVSPSVYAVLRLITKSNFVGCSTSRN